MDEMPALDPKVLATLPGYKDALRDFDIVVGEACAVSQAIGHRQADPHAGYASIFFARVCAHAVSMVRALPLTRWVRSDFDHWDFGAVAGHARAIAEGHLTFMYLAETPASTEQWSAKLNVMHLCDCARRITMFSNLGADESVKGFEEQKAELQDRLTGNAYFMGLPDAVRKDCLRGRYLTIANRNELAESLGLDIKQFNFFFDLLSQHTHILTMSFYRMEPNGRGTGIENDVDRGYMSMAMLWCTAVLIAEMDRLIELFPDVASARAGPNSKFSPGPISNLPAWRLAEMPKSVSLKKRKGTRRLKGH